MHSEEIIPLSIIDLLSNDKYLIPIYQRNYDWGEKETLQLIQDIADFASINPNKKYYIGSLVVFIQKKAGQECFEIIDGQQRLTTLNILMNVLKNVDEVSSQFDWFSTGRLTYDHRPESDEALNLLYDGRLSEQSSANSIVDVYKIIKKNIKNILTEKNIEIKDFVKYLLSNVIIMRIPVPRDTDLNHYFEIMNSRGEQLEKHEVLKASLMNHLDKGCHILFDEIWEACSFLNSYVQMNFKPNVRSIIFSNDWATLQFGINDFDELNKKISLIDEKNNNDDTENGYRSISQLFDDAASNKKYPLPDSDDNDEGKDRFGSVINFPNFLLHVLKVMYHSDCEYNQGVDDNIRLDDKRLVSIFDMVLNNCQDKTSFVKRFIMALLIIRSLFDRYVIKRENYNGKECWSLKDIKKYDHSKINYVCTFNNSTEDETEISKDIKMLEAMFHVSAPTQIYKHWLNAVLSFVYSKGINIIPEALREYLYSLACAYMHGRYLCEKGQQIDFEDIIYKYKGQYTNKNLFWKAIDNGCNVENFVFNFYDYVIWKNDNGKKYNKFEFTYRTSVEHFYPQTPMVGYLKLTDETGLNDFGNLCLISRGMNSKFSNNMPIAKLKNFGNEAISQELSIKLNEMMVIAENKGEWGTTEIKEFEQKCIETISKAIQ